MCQTVAIVRVGDIIELTIRTRAITDGRWDGRSEARTITAEVIRSIPTADNSAFDVDYRSDSEEGECRLHRNPARQPTWGVSDWRLVASTRPQPA